MESLLELEGNFEVINKRDEIGVDVRRGLMKWF